MTMALARFEAWVDGSGGAADGPAAIGVVLVADGAIVCEASEAIGIGSNNVAEVRAVGRALALAYAVGRSREAAVLVRSDSAFAIGACTPGSTWRLRSNPALTELCLAVRAEAARWPNLAFHHVPGHANAGLNPRADRLAGRARRAEMNRVACASTKERRDLP
jgi:ribonuclease HI